MGFWPGNTYAIPVKGLPLPISYWTGFERPWGPTTSRPLHLLNTSPHQRHHFLFPWRQNRDTDIFRFGNQRYMPPLYAVFERGDPGKHQLNNQQHKQLIQHISDLLQRERAKLRPPTKIVPGWGGLDYARARRIAPDTPSKSRGIYRDQPANVPFGRRWIGAPTTTMDELARARANYRDRLGNPAGTTQVANPKTDTPKWAAALLLFGALWVGMRAGRTEAA